jgi:hypothetical protein
MMNYTRRNKILFFLCVFLLIKFFIPMPLAAFEKLPERYTISLGSSEAPHQITEYFSLSCPICVKLLKTDFKDIYSQYVAKKQLYWTFHPDPQDITTLQLMICLEKLPYSKRWSFFWEAVQAVKVNNSGRNTFLLQELSKQFGLDVPLLHEIQWIETTEAYKKAYQYIQQPDAPTEIPTIEFDSLIKDKILPTKNSIQELMT